MAIPSLALVDGRIVPAAEARVPLEDRGFLFAEAIYEVMVAQRGRVFAGGLHLERLRRSAALIGLPIAKVEPLIREGIDALLGAFGDGGALVYLQVTGGAAPRDHLAPAGLEPRFYMTVRPFDLRAVGDARAIAAVSHPEIRWAFATAKTTQLLASVMGKRRAREQGADEVLFLTEEGALLEGGSTNVFVVRDGRALTPPDSRNILPGVTRRILLERCAEHCAEGELTRDALVSAGEAFVTSTTRGVAPLTSVDGRPVGDGAPGPLTRRLAAQFRGFVEEELGPLPR